MNYAIEILKCEKMLLERALSGWPEGRFPDARKVRDERLRDINEAIQLIENHE